jgi:6-phosphogluconolactonase
MKISELIANKLKSSIEINGEASLVLSGGNSPLKIYNELSNTNINWSSVNTTLVDDRLVEKNHPDSNQKLLFDNLIKNKANALNFIPLSKDIIKKGFVQTPFDICLLGMGLDGHFASLFPDMVNDSNAFDLNKEPEILEISAHGDPFVPRITMNFPLILKSHLIILLVKGKEKERVLNLSYKDKSLPLYYLLNNKNINLHIENIN